MILRQWRGRTAWTRADEYASYLLETGVRDCEKTPGCRGVYVLSTPARKFDDVFWSCNLGEFPTMILEFGQECSQVLAGELPLEGLSHPLVLAVESKQAIPQRRKRRKVVRREHFALHDGEVDLDLVEPAGMNGGVDRDDRRPATAKPFVGFPAAVGRAVVHDPENPSGRTVGLFPHDLRDQPSEGGDPGRGLTAAEDLGPAHVPGRKVGPGAFPFVLVLDPHRLAPPWGAGGVNPSAGPGAGLLVGGGYESAGGPSAAPPHGPLTGPKPPPPP